ncbi:MAG: hypothetical protein WBA93_21780 [Microcoleaceae cyanobacterium]
MNSSKELTIDIAKTVYIATYPVENLAFLIIVEDGFVAIPDIIRRSLVYVIISQTRSYYDYDLRTERKKSKNRVG